MTQELFIYERKIDRKTVNKSLVTENHTYTETEHRIDVWETEGLERV